MNSNSLYKLVKSLDKSEKRYFKLFANQHGKAKNAILLFDLIDKQNDFEELSIKRSISKDGVKTPLPVLKNSLFQLVVKSLIQYRANSSNDIALKIKDWMNQAQIIIQQGLIEEGIKILEKALDIAEEAEKFILQYELQERLRRVKRFKNHVEKEKYYNTVFQREEEILAHQKEYVTFVKLWNQWSHQQHKSIYARTDEDYQFINKLLEHPMLAEDYKTSSTRAEGYRLAVLGDCYRYIEQYDKAMEFHERAFLIKLDKNVFKEDTKSYISGIHNVLIHSLLSRNMVVTAKYVEMIHPDNFESEEMKIHAFVRYYLNRTNAFKFFFQSEEGIEFAKKHFDYFIENESKFTPVHWGFGVLETGILYFMNKNYEEALNQFDKVEYHKSIESLGSLVSFIKILKLFCYYELNERNIITHYIRATHRYMKSRKRMFEFENIVFNHLKSMMNYVLSGDQKAGYKLLLDKIKPLRNTPYEQNAFNYFDFDVWLESRITNKTMLEIAIAQNLLPKDAS